MKDVIIETKQQLIRVIIKMILFTAILIFSFFYCSNELVKMKAFVIDSENILQIMLQPVYLYALYFFKYCFCPLIALLNLIGWYELIFKRKDFFKD